MWSDQYDLSIGGKKNSTAFTNEVQSVVTCFCFNFLLLRKKKKSKGLSAGEMIQRVKAFFLGKPGDWTSMTRTQKKAEGESQLHKVILWLPTLQCALSCAMPHPQGKL